MAAFTTIAAGVGAATSLGGGLMSFGQSAKASKQAADAQKFETAFERSTGKIQGALVDVLSIIANKKQLNLVLAKSQVILVGKDIDLTDEAIKELNKVLPKITLDK